MKKLICKVVENMNSTYSQKYGYALDEMDEKTVKSKKLRDIYDFYRLVKVKQHAERYKCADIKKDKKNYAKN